MIDIVSLPIFIDREKIDSRFRMVVLAKERARQIINGAKTVVPTRYIKASTMALAELSEAKIDYVTGKEARKAMQEAAAAAQSLRAMPVTGANKVDEEIKKEIEKDLGIYMPEPGDSASGPESSD